MTPCILSKRGKDKNGYPKSLYWKGRRLPEHRKIYLEANNLAPDGLPGQVIRHICDNRMCINLDHLIEGTHQQNSLDAVQRGRITGQKLMTEDVVDIRKCAKEGVRSKDLALLYGVSVSTIVQIRCYQTWKILGVN